MSKEKNYRSRFKSALTRAVVELGIFSFFINVLLLVSPLYLLQVYDRVLSSASQETLIYISIIAVVALALLGALEAVRAQYAARLAARLDAAYGADALKASMFGPRAELGDVQPMRDLASIRGFMSSRSAFFFFDLPFTPLFIALLYFVHPVLFWITLAGAGVLIGIVLLNQLATAKEGAKANELNIASTAAGQTFTRNAETLRALGMVTNMIERWGGDFARSIDANDKVAKRNAMFQGLSRTVRMSLQILILGAGAYLVLSGNMTAGMIFATSIISGRALQPLDQIIGAWKQIAEVNRARSRLNVALGQFDKQQQERTTVELPEPRGEILVEKLFYQLPGSKPGTPPLIRGLHFGLRAGESAAIIGPSRAGKSTLARLLVGAIRPSAGTIRLDAADINNWDVDRLGNYIGYLPQEVELLPGTIAENMARFDPQASDEQVIAAARNAHVHDLILSQPNGYSTIIGPGGVRLSGGERQRIGLARAFYGNPKVLVLDEPNANLDNEGELALERALAKANEAKMTVFLITHRPSVARKCHRVLVLREGQIERYGPADEVLQKLAASQQGEQSNLQAKPQAANSVTPASFGQVQRVRANNGQ